MNANVRSNSGVLRPAIAKTHPPPKRIPSASGRRRDPQILRFKHTIISNAVDEQRRLSLTLTSSPFIARCVPSTQVDVATNGTSFSYYPSPETVVSSFFRGSRSRGSYHQHMVLFDHGGKAGRMHSQYAAIGVCEEEGENRVRGLFIMES